MTLCAPVAAEVKGPIPEVQPYRTKSCNTVKSGPTEYVLDTASL